MNYILLSIVYIIAIVFALNLFNSGQVSSAVTVIGVVVGITLYRLYKKQGIKKDEKS